MLNLGLLWKMSFGEYPVLIIQGEKYLKSRILGTKFLPLKMTGQKSAEDQTGRMKIAEIFGCKWTNCQAETINETGGQKKYISE